MATHREEKVDSVASSPTAVAPSLSFDDAARVESGGEASSQGEKCPETPELRVPC